MRTTRDQLGSSLGQQAGEDEAYEALWDNLAALPWADVDSATEKVALNGQILSGGSL
jgi:hypothetical protein